MPPVRPKVYVRGEAYQPGELCLLTVQADDLAVHTCTERRLHRGLCLSPEGYAWDAENPTTHYLLEP
jgi:hypothetical protein